MATAFFTSQWAEAVRRAVNTEPDEEYKADKLVMYWDWIKLARESFNGSLALGVRGDGRYVRLDFSAGDCERAGVVTPEQAAEATFVLVANDGDWKAIMSGYNTSKAVMYRKLMLEQGDVFRFFNRIYFFTEALASIARVPTDFPASA